MTRGAGVTEDKINEFRQAYLVKGTIAAAARAVDLPYNTAWKYAKEADGDPEFVEKRDAIRARVVDEAEDLLRESFIVVQERVLENDLSPDELASIATKYDLKSFSYQNPKPQYFKGLIDAYKALVARHKDSDGSGDGSSTEVHIHLKGVADDIAPQDGDGSD